MTTGVRPFGLLCVAAGLAAAVPSAAAIAYSAGVDWQLDPAGPVLFLLLGGLVLAFLGGLLARADVLVGCLAALFFLAMLCIGAELAGRAVERTRDWYRTPQAVSVTVTECQVYQEAAGPFGDRYGCLHSWTFDGRQLTERRLAGDHPDGRRIRLWMDPDDGSLDDHALVTILGATAFGLFTGALALLMALLAVESFLTQIRAAVRGAAPLPD
ncbi:hypothetical protein [Kitasatospora sp. DSM 101779]|uniref:hypothetical protein n=1 Tax=Kitasatospora sp. DSM 101779 TaxID=2853165 RepID=UPI0021D9929B|nr:hypothetical protein [Kitasatospora sp. DSM 101779]MCU7821797.1 hypothetical protein [Kitasatospora sp. DSM 101779]